MAFWYDGDLLEESDAAPHSSQQQIPLDNAGLRFGATVFTTLRVYQGDLHHPLTQWQGHCDRLNQSLQQFGWSIPNWTAIYRGCQQLKDDYAVLRVTLFPDGREWITGRPLPPHLTAQQQTGISCWVASPDYARSLPTHKTGNYLACWLARQQAQSQGAHEAILTNPQGEWLETSTGNLWVWAHNQWWTPRNTQCLPGLMQRWLSKKIAAADQQLCYLPLPATQLPNFEAVAYSNCVVGLLPIHTILNGAIKLEYNPQHVSIQMLQSHIARAAKSSQD